MKKLIYISVTAIAVLFMGCDKSDELVSTNKESIGASLKNEQDDSFSEETREIRPTILGEKKENPFSVENMKIALEKLIEGIENGEIDGDVIPLEEAAEYEIKATDLYVRFLPQNKEEYDSLMNDTTLALFDHPLDYEIKEYGDYYHDPDIPEDKYTWLYAVVKPDYKPQTEDIKYEVLSDLFIIENSKDYTEETKETKDKSISTLQNSKTGLIDQDFCNALYVMSFHLTGNEKELSTSASEEQQPANAGLAKVKIDNCTRKCVGKGWFKYCWTSCEPYYYPDGYIKVSTPNGNIGVKGVKVRMWRWFSYADARTNANGYYYCSAKFNSLWIGNNIDYHVIFEGKNSGNTWTFNKSLFGAVCLWTNYYGAGSHSPAGHSMTFYTNSDYWGRCVLNNAVYDYCNIARNEGIALPPNNLDIANKQSSDFTSSAPLLKNHINFSLLYAWGIPGAIAELWGYSLFGWAFPDLILRYNKNMEDYNEIISIAWHELTHASQLQRMKTEKNYLWASDYWSHVVYQEATNEINNGDPYGSKGDNNWQIIALAEGWANYRQWDLSRRILSWNSLTGTSWTSTSTFPTTTSFYRTWLDFPEYYVCMFYDLATLGCSSTNVEKALCSYSIGEFKEKLIAKYPNLNTQITNLIVGYE